MAARIQKSLPFVEHISIVITVLLLFLFAAKRMEVASYLVNQERAHRELLRIYQMQEDTKEQTGTYNEEIPFTPKYAYYGVLYSVKVQNSGSEFVAYAVEVLGRDPFGDSVPGNEYIAIDASGNFSEGSFVAEND